MSTGYILWALAGAVVAFILTRKFGPVNGCTNISAGELNDLMAKQKGIKILDVRTAAEYESGHIPGALSRPLASLEKWAPQLKRGQEYYLICASGNRSKTAARMLVRKGFTNLFNVKGGMRGWQGPIK